MVGVCDGMEYFNVSHPKRFDAVGTTLRGISIVSLLLTRVCNSTIIMLENYYQLE